METRRDVFQAIADPTRRKIIGILAHQSMNLNRISDNFEMSRQAVSLHIKILQECNLVSIKKHGRERICEAKLENLNEVYEWVEQYNIFWTRKLKALKHVVENTPTEPSKTLKNKPTYPPKRNK